eukprot:12885-Eustigmatos_ZCMA.PRE.1
MTDARKILSSHGCVRCCVSTRAGGPLVWSVSYGFPEAAQAMITGEDSWAYVERANVALMKLAMLGVTVLVASGDDG